VDALTTQLDEAQDKAERAEKFVALGRKYTEAQELTTTMVNEFIQRIDIHILDKSSGHRQQRGDIIYNFVGMMEPPTDAQEPTIQVNSILIAWKQPNSELHSGLGFLFAAPLSLTAGWARYCQEWYCRWLFFPVQGWAGICVPVSKRPATGGAWVLVPGHSKAGNKEVRSVPNRPDSLQPSR